MKSSHSCCRKVHKALLNSRRCYCTVELYYVAENFIAQQKVLLHNRKFYYTAEGFTAQQKVLLHNKKVRPVAETREKFILWQKQRISPLCSVFSWTLDLMFAHKLAVAEWYFGAHLAERQANFLLRKSLDQALSNYIKTRV